MSDYIPPNMRGTGAASDRNYLLEADNEVARLRDDRDRLAGEVARLTVLVPAPFDVNIDLVVRDHVAELQQEVIRLNDENAALTARWEKARTVLMLHSPVRYGQGQTFICDWCGKVWEGAGGRAENPHPANGCLMTDLEAQR